MPIDIAFYGDGGRESFRNESNKILFEAFKIDDAALWAATGKLQNLFNQICASLGALVGGLDHAQLLLISEFMAKQLGRHEDRSEHVVQIVGDSASKRADAVHALAAEDLGFEFLFV